MLRIRSCCWPRAGFRRLTSSLRHLLDDFRRAAVVGVAAAFLLLALLPRQPDRQWIYLSHVNRPQPAAVLLPVDSPQAKRIRRMADHIAQPAQQRLPPSYAQARWRFEAATHYIRELQTRWQLDADLVGRSGRGDVASPGRAESLGWPSTASGGTVATVAFRQTAGSQPPARQETPYGMAYWQAQRDAAERQMQRLLASAAADAGAPWEIGFGATERGAASPVSMLLALLAGCAAAAAYGFRPRRPARLLCQALCQVQVPADWVRVRPPAAERMRQWTYRCAWASIGVCAALQYLGSSVRL